MKLQNNIKDIYIYIVAVGIVFDSEDSRMILVHIWQLRRKISLKAMKVSVYFSKTEKLIFSKDVNPQDYTFGLIIEDISKKLNVDRYRIGVKAEKCGRLLRLPDYTSLVDIPSNEPDELKLYFTDLGVQIGYRTTFVLEYLAALLTYLALYLRFEKLSSRGHTKFVPMNVRLAAACWIWHFCKRLYESVFIHKFSRATMPMGSTIRNILYYGGFGVLVGYYVNHPLQTDPGFRYNIFFCCFFMFFSYCNFKCHQLLSSLRKSDNESTRNLPNPTGMNPTFLYNWVSFPNYFYEIMTWVSYAILTRNIASWIFTFVGAITMTKWALQKQSEYKKRNCCGVQRKAIIPAIL